MHSTPTAKPNDDPHDVLVVAPDAVRVAPEDELSSLLHEAAARYGSETQTREGPGVKGSDSAAAPTVPPVDTTFRPAAVNGVPVAGKPWSMVRRAARGFTALLLAVCIGVAAIVWRSYGDAAEKKIAKWTTQLVLTASLPPEKSASPAQPAAPAVVADAANPAPPQPGSPQPAAPAQIAPQSVAPAAAAPSADSAQLQSMSRDLASLGQEVEQLKASIEQLKTGQQQMSRDVAKASEVKASEVKASEVKASEVKASEVKASEQNLRPRISTLPPRPAVARPRNPMPAYAPPRQAALPPAAAPYPAPAPYYPPNYAQRQTDYLPRPPQPQPQYAAEPPAADPELSAVPRPPMPLRE
jgi:hypothetical protein